MPEALSELERVTLGVLGAGLAPADLANDPTLRLDYVTAVSLALQRGLSETAYLEPGGGQARRDFQRELTDALYDLEQKGVLGVGGPPPGLMLDGSVQPPVRPARVEVANFDQPPKVFDRYLAGRCLDELLRQPAVYHFVMGKYADSSEVWQRVYKQYL